MKRILLIILILFVSGCGVTGEELTSIDNRPATGVITGDSIANFIGRYEIDGNRYIETRFNTRINNSGHNSWASWDIVNTWQAEVINTAQEFVILNIGTKDCNIEYGYPLDETKKNFIYFAQTAQANNIKLYVCNIAPADFYTTETNERIEILNTWLEQEMPTYNAIVIDMFSFAEDETRQYKLKPEYYTDGIHPNSNGCKMAIEFMYETIKRDML